jgi:mono/diheme cytochrome c family protein
MGRKVYETKSCNACHGDGGVGTNAGPRLVGIGSRIPPNKLAVVLKQPTDKMMSGGMTAIDISDQELQALVAYIEGLK